MEQGQFGAGPGKGGGVPGFQGQVVGAGMSGVRLVGALGRDQTYVSAGNPTHREGSGRRRGGRGKLLVPRAGVGSGGNSKIIQRILVGLVCLVGLERRLLALLRWVSCQYWCGA